MDPLIGSALIGGGFSFGGGLASGIMGMREAAKNRAWQERMRATQYQVMRKDMEAAGLNPILGLGTGGAGTPSGAVGNVSGFSTMGGAVGSALAAMKLGKELDLLDAQTDKTRREATMTEVLTGYHSQQTAGSALANTEAGARIHVAIGEVNKRLRELQWHSEHPEISQRGERNKALSVVGRTLADLEDILTNAGDRIRSRAGPDANRQWESWRDQAGQLIQDTIRDALGDRELRQRRDSGPNREPYQEPFLDYLPHEQGEQRR